VEVLTVTGLNTTTSSVGKFVSQTMDRIIDKKLLAKVSWQGTAEKMAFSSLETIVDLIRGKREIL
jgi:hypothetical protein